MKELALSQALHRLTSRLDHAADQILRSDAGISYPRFLALYMVGLEGADTQRALSERLGVTEPSVSRMTRVLAQAGLLEAVADPAGGNRRVLRLTSAGREVVERCGEDLEQRFAAMVKASGVPYHRLAEDITRLLDTLDVPAPAPRHHRRALVTGGHQGDQCRGDARTDQLSSDLTRRNHDCRQYRWDGRGGDRRRWGLEIWPRLPALRPRVGG